MAQSEYSRELRNLVGNRLLQVPTAGVLVWDDVGRLLLVKNADDEAWGVPGGMIEPLETPADAAVRETWEETGIKVQLTGILGVFAGRECQTTYPNGDTISWVATIFHADALEGKPRPDFNETLEVQFFPLDAIKNIPHRPHVDQFLEAFKVSGNEPWFASPTWKPGINNTP